MSIERFSIFSLQSFFYIPYRSRSNPKDNTWKVTWYVTSREDIGDFYIVVRNVGLSNSVDKSNVVKPIFEKEVVYIERSLTIENLPKDSSVKQELCVLARDSIGNVKHFRKSQCKILDRNVSSSSETVFGNRHTVLAMVLIALTVIII